MHQQGGPHWEKYLLCSQLTLGTTSRKIFMEAPIILYILYYITYKLYILYKL